MASRGRGKRVHYISTYATLPKHLGYEVPEDHMDYGYLTSKWMGEQMVVAARWRGALTSTYRLPFVGACAHTGRFRLDRGDFLHNLIAGCIDMGSFPSLDSDLRGLLSVDYMTEVIARLTMSDPERIGKNYDFINPGAPTFNGYVELLRDVGCQVETVPYAEWQAQALEYANANKTGSLARIAALVDDISKSDLEIMLEGYPVCGDVLGGDVYPCPTVEVNSIQAYVERISAAQLALAEDTDRASLATADTE